MRHVVGLGTSTRRVFSLRFCGRETTRRSPPVTSALLFLRGVAVTTKNRDCSANTETCPATVGGTKDRYGAEANRHGWNTEVALDAARLHGHQEGNGIRTHKSQNPADKVAVAEQVALLKQHNDAEFPTTEAKSASIVANEKKTDSKKGKGGGYNIKVPKGTKDFSPQEMAVREHIFSTITQVFRKHGAVTIDTPIFELREILAGKYGEDSKLIYDLEDQGGEICSLRYDLTVPFARFVATNPSLYQNIKRYHIAKVYRRDQPAITKGRMREFYQCDFDIAGAYDPMIPDSEALRILVEVLDNLNVGKYTIKVNHRKILDGIFAVCGVPADIFRPISSAVDKLDKLPWAEVRKEMVEEKGLDPVAADKIGEYVKLKGGKELCDALLQDPTFVENESANAGVKDMKLLFNYLQVFDVIDKVSFDLSLARGLDYYTGIIYEAVLDQDVATEISSRPQDPTESEEASIPIGSIAAGGRYDDLVGMFTSTPKKAGSEVPCVGFSVGVERVFSILWKRAREQEENLRSSETQVLVIAVGDGLLEERMKICVELWENNIQAEFMYKVKPKLPKQFNACDRDRIPLAVIIGKDEVDSGIVRIKSMAGKIEAEGPGIPVKRTDMISDLRKRIASISPRY